MINGKEQTLHHSVIWMISITSVANWFISSWKSLSDQFTSTSSTVTWKAETLI
ncbi:MAG: hypothetical protein HUJ74_02060 [Lachnospiraceae bacterium]|nr:hypothetical protein [Lachnospiraceae bacterium]